MTRPASMWLLTGLAVALVAAAQHRRHAETRLDSAAMTELSRRLDQAVSGGSSPLKQTPRDPHLTVGSGNRVSDLR